MPTPDAPRHGSLQVWPRKRAKRIYPRVRTWPQIKDAKALGFAGYKVGMCHVLLQDNRKNSLSKGETISIPATIVECPPIKVFGVRLYTKDAYGIHPAKDIIAAFPKDLERKMRKPKNLDAKAFDSLNLNNYDSVSLLVSTQPRLTGLSKKTPEVFEIAYSQKDPLKIKELLGKDLAIENAIAEGELVDIHAVTRGKGTQGPTKRFGLNLRSHKSEKTRRGPGSLGPWHPARISYRVAHLGQMGFHARTDYNKLILKIAKPEEMANKSGFKHYGAIKSQCLLIKGSIPGPEKRLVRLNASIRPNAKLKDLVPQVQQIIVKG